MRVTGVIRKSFTEQIRQFWLLLLTVGMAPFFIFVYYLIIEASKVRYDLVILNQDQGLQMQAETVNHGDILTGFARDAQETVSEFPLKIVLAENRDSATKRVKANESDALVIIPEDFSQRLHDLSRSKQAAPPEIEFVGDLTNVKYMITAVWVNEILSQYITRATGISPPLKILETALGSSAGIDDFTYSVPGLLILSIIMLMFTAAIAVITEVENMTMLRLKLSPLTAFEYLTGVSVVQTGVGLISTALALVVAIGLGFQYSGSLLLLLLVAVLTSMSVIGFSLIIAAFTKSVSEVLIVGNFPLFFFMFFTGVAFPIGGKSLFTVAGYAVTLPGLMSPNHAVSALRKVLVMGMELQDILPELTALVILTVVYFAIGILIFQRRHMRIG